MLGVTSRGHVAALAGAVVFILLAGGRTDGAAINHAEVHVKAGVLAPGATGSSEDDFGPFVAAKSTRYDYQGAFGGATASVQGESGSEWRPLLRAFANGVAAGDRNLFSGRGTADAIWSDRLHYSDAVIVDRIENLFPGRLHVTLGADVSGRCGPGGSYALFVYAERVVDGQLRHIGNSAGAQGEAAPSHQPVSITIPGDWPARGASYALELGVSGGSAYDAIGHSWCRFIDKRPELRRPDPRVGISPFTKQPMTFRPRDDAAEVVVDGNVIGDASWSQSEEPLVNVSVEPAGLSLVNEWAAELNCVFVAYSEDDVS